MWDELWKDIKQEWAVLKQAPYAVIINTVIAFALACWVVNWHYTGTINALNSTIDNYKVMLQVSSPEETKKRIEHLEILVKKAHQSKDVVTKACLERVVYYPKLPSIPDGMMEPPVENDFLAEFNQMVNEGIKPSETLISYIENAELNRVKLDTCQSFVKEVWESRE
jgi:hypothetical protein